MKGVDWAKPWFKPYRAVGEPVLQAWQGGQALAQGLTQAAQAQALPVRFVEQQQALSAAAYERMIASERAVPTRNSWHDFFNGLVWLKFPHIKQVLNQLQVQGLAQEQAEAASRRSPLRDALTIFDENAVFLEGASPALIDAVQAHRWREAFEQRVDEWQAISITIFGHALLDQLRVPRMNLAGHVWLGSRPPVAQELLRGDCRTPLVVMGCPQWAAAARLPVDLNDSRVFRPKPVNRALIRRDADNRPR